MSQDDFLNEPPLSLSHFHLPRAHTHTHTFNAHEAERALSDPCTEPPLHCFSHLTYHRASNASPGIWSAVIFSRQCHRRARVCNRNLALGLFGLSLRPCPRGGGSIQNETLPGLSDSRLLAAAAASIQTEAGGQINPGQAGLSDPPPCQQTS